MSKWPGRSPLFKPVPDLTRNFDEARLRFESLVQSFVQHFVEVLKMPEVIGFDDEVKV